MQEAQTLHQQQEDQRRDQLQKELLSGREAEILILADLLPVVQKPDGPKDQREQQHEDMLIMPLQHARKAQCQADENLRQDEHHPAHGGGAALAGVLLELGLDLLTWPFPFPARGYTIFRKQ